MCGGEEHFVGSVDQALKLSEVENLAEYFQERAHGLEPRDTHGDGLLPWRYSPNQ